MRVSTVIPVYNREQFVARAVDCALRQDVEGHEIIIVDNHSTDRTWEVCKAIALKDSRVRCHQNDRNLGPVQNWIRGVELASGEYCHLLFSDDLIGPEFLARTISLMDEETGFVLAGCDNCNAAGTYNASTFQERGEWSRSEVLEAGVFANPSGIHLVSPIVALFRRKDLRASLVPDIPNSSGIDFAAHGAGPDQLVFLLVARQYPKVRCVNQVLTSFFSHGESISVQMRDLRLPREWAKWFFVRNYWPEAAARYRATLLVRAVRSPVLWELYNAVAADLGGGVSWRQLVGAGTAELGRVVRKTIGLI